MYDNTSNELNMLTESGLTGLDAKARQAITDFIFMSHGQALRHVDAAIAFGCPHVKLMEKVAEAARVGVCERFVLSGKYSAKSGRVMDERLPEKYRDDSPYSSEAEMMARVLSDMGIDERKFVLENRSQNTYENARFSCDILFNEERIGSGSINTSPATIGLFCQAFHARRAYMTVRKVLTEIGHENTEVFVFSADTQGISAQNWWQDEYGRRRVGGEVERIARYFGESALPNSLLPAGHEADLFS